MLLDFRLAFVISVGVHLCSAAFRKYYLDFCWILGVVGKIVESAVACGMSIAY